ncbi:MAG: diacylglycerol kinase family protein [Gammaproteobacteria bacterium]|nr:diacylglycerol kinase family protein [Gammaproteobacteria bacterium]
MAILSNAGSGRNRGRNALLRTLDAVSGVHHRITRSAEEVDAALAELLAPAPAVLAVNGGDGTVQAVLTALEQRGGGDCPPLAILPAGSTNMTAHDLRCGGP